jgi:AAA+ ATPase superfamily predicted ATPase
MARLIIGRAYEQAKLQSALNSKEAEFIAVYGRRRVGKTYLIRNFFSGPVDQDLSKDLNKNSEKIAENECTFFSISGILNATLTMQLEEFHEEVQRTFNQQLGGVRLEKPKTWMAAFKNLTFVLNLAVSADKSKKIVMFFDEFPWMATQKSKLLQALDYYWNRFWSDIPNVILIICGSAASWIIKHILNNKGGLHNRVTMRLSIKPFTLRETREFLNSRGVKYDPMQILQLYMAIGGIPYYLKSVEKGLSAVQNINQMCFQKEGTLLDEFDNLFSSLFSHFEMHEAIVKLIAPRRDGVSRQEIETSLGYVGGDLTKKLRELEEAGFLMLYHSKGRSYGKYYKLIDEYTLFYLNWIAPRSLSSFDEVMGTSQWNDWAGYSFELTCLKHMPELRKILNIPESASPESWRYIPKQKENFSGAQIDLLFDRQDGVINLCEIKYSVSPYAIDKSYAAILKNKAEMFKKVTKTEKQIFISMITTLGLKETMYSEELVSNQAKLEDLF